MSLSNSPTRVTVTRVRAPDDPNAPGLAELPCGESLGDDPFAWTWIGTPEVLGLYGVAPNTPATTHGLALAQRGRSAISHEQVRRAGLHPGSRGTPRFPAVATQAWTFQPPDLVWKSYSTLDVLRCEPMKLALRGGVIAAFDQLIRHPIAPQRRVDRGRTWRRATGYAGAAAVCAKGHAHALLVAVQGSPGRLVGPGIAQVNVQEVLTDVTGRFHDTTAALLRAAGLLSS